MELSCLHFLSYSVFYKLLCRNSDAGCTLLQQQFYSCQGMKFTEIMSVNEFEGCVRCWTCKSSGIDRFFEGNAERQLHENSMHSSIYQHKNYTRKGTTSDFAIDCGSSFRKNGKLLYFFLSFYMNFNASDLQKCVIFKSTEIKDSFHKILLQ